MSVEKLRFGGSGSRRRKISLPLLLTGIALALSLLGPIAAATPSEPSGVAVEYLASTLTLRIVQSTDLRTVLLAVCQHTEAECIIASYTSEIRVAPITLTGTWDEVVAKLAGRFNLNYAAAVPTPGRPGMLTVVGSVTNSGEEMMLKGNRNSFESAPDGLSSPADLTPASPDLTEQIFQQRWDSKEPLKGSNSLPASLPGGFGGPVGVDPASELSRGKEATSNPDQLQASESSFRTMYGGALLANQPLGPSPRTVVLPYSDPNGNPITTSVTNDPVTVLPWPGPDGLPIIVSPGMPGLKLDPPIQPSTPAL